MSEDKKIGDVLVEMGLITRPQLEQALTLQKTKYKRIGKILEELGIVTGKQVAEGLAKYLSLPLVDCVFYTITDKMKSIVPREMVIDKLVLPVELKNDTLLLAMVDPLDWETTDLLKFKHNLKISPAVTDEKNLISAMEKKYGASVDGQKVTELSYAYKKHELLGSLIVTSGLITQEQLEEALKVQKTRKKRIGKLIVEMGFASGKQVAEVIARQLSLPFVDCEKYTVSNEIKLIVPLEIAEKKYVMPLEIKNDTLILAMANPLDCETIDLLSFMTNLKISPVVAEESNLLQAIEKNYEVSEKVSEFIESMGGQTVEFVEKTEDKEAIMKVEDMRKNVEAAPVVKIVTMVISDAVKVRASDIHITPREKNLQVRYRVDGELKDALNIPKYLQNPVISRIKVKSGLDITKRRIPQDGTSRLIVGNREIDLRISTLPSIHGENVVIRLLDSSVGLVPLIQLGIPEHILKSIIEIFSRPQGMLLITGPTGSGKTTTLYAGLNQLKRDTENIITVENPVEYKLDGITQVSLDVGTGLTFASVLRSILRQDPDTIMIGEIRDQETAEIAIKATLTGHLVLSTLHTNDTVATITRLVDIGIPNLLVSTAITGILAQRLVRKICEKCKAKIEVPDDLKDTLPPLKGSYKGEGCPQCFHTGYRGRVGVYEFLEFNSKLRELIVNNAMEAELWAAAKESGTVRLFDEAWSRVEEGITTIEEVLTRVPIVT